MKPRTSEWVKVFAAESVSDIVAPQEEYDVFIAPESGVYEYGPGTLRATQAPTLNDGRAFADHFIKRQLRGLGLPMPVVEKSEVPIPLTRRKM